MGVDRNRQISEALHSRNLMDTSQVESIKFSHATCSKIPITRLQCHGFYKQKNLSSTIM